MNASMILETRSQSANVRHDETTRFRCCDCGEVKPSVNGQVGNYAILPDDRLCCYACADKRQIADLKDRSKPFTAYLSSDGQTVTSWTGGKLMTVTQSSPCRLMRQSFTHDRNSFRSIRARDVHGANWYGRGSAGIAITLRACK